MPTWVWVLIAVIALVIIIAVVVAGRNGKQVDAPHSEPLVPGTPAAGTPLAPRRGLEPDPAEADSEALLPEPPLSPGRHQAEEDVELEVEEQETLDTVAESLHAEAAPDDLDEDTLHAPLTFPDDVAPAHALPEDAELGVGPEAEPEAPAVEEAPEPATEPEPLIEDFAADAPVEEPATAPQDTLVDEPVETADSSAARTHAEDSDLTQLGDYEDLDVEQEDEASAAVEETVELGEDQGDIDELPSPAGDAPEAGDDVAPQHADRGDYGDVLPDDDVPRDEQGRRLDPYGNPVD